MARTTKTEVVTLVHPDGEREYRTDDRVEITRLKAHGYTEKKASGAAQTKQRTPANKAATPADK